ncbi:uncharacterized protein LOC135962253 [Calliphora vicina]|uniref:uncharacterized protein LOC135962253 n=1 Tax=Calliphora vicina TaxID=7373 RepID=UPI00325BABFA
MSNKNLIHVDITEKIITEVSKYECLYNKDSESFTNYQYKETIWSKIGKDIGIPAIEVKKKFKNIRDAYKKYKKMVMSPGNDTILRRPYKYAAQLQFLEDPNADMTACHISESSLDKTTDSFSETDVSFSKKRKLEHNDNSWRDPIDEPSSSFVIIPNNTTKNDLSQDYWTTNPEQPEPHSDNDCQSSDSCSPGEKTIDNSETITTTNKTKSRRKRKGKTNCTMQLFQCLANKISDSNLTVEQKNHIEISVCRLVYSKIIEYTTID